MGFHDCVNHYIFRIDSRSISRRSGCRPRPPFSSSIISIVFIIVQWNKPINKRTVPTTMMNRDRFERVDSGRVLHV